MRYRLRTLQTFAFRLIRGERILPLVLALSINPDDNVYDYIYNGESPTTSPSTFFLDGSDPFEVDFVAFIDGGDPFSEMPMPS